MHSPRLPPRRLPGQDATASSSARMAFPFSVSSVRFPKFVKRCGMFTNKLRKAKGTSKISILVPLVSEVRELN